MANIGEVFTLAKETGITEAASEAAGKLIKEVLRVDGAVGKSSEALSQSVLARVSGSNTESTLATEHIWTLPTQLPVPDRV